MRRLRVKRAEGPPTPARFSTLGEPPKTPKKRPEPIQYINLSYSCTDTFKVGGLPALIMAQVPYTPEAQPTTTTLTGAEVTPAVILPLDKIVKAHGMTTDGPTMGEDSVHSYALTIVRRDPVTNAVIDTQDLNGTIEVGASYERSQTTALPLTAVLHDLGGLRAPQIQHAINTAVEVAAMRRDGATDDECAAYYASNGVNWSAESNAKNTLLKRLRAASIRTVKAAIKVVRA